jgi:hypothetical protein
MLAIPREWVESHVAESNPGMEGRFPVHVVDKVNHAQIGSGEVPDFVSVFFFIKTNIIKHKIIYFKYIKFLFLHCKKRLNTVDPVLFAGAAKETTWVSIVR